MDGDLGWDLGPEARIAHRNNSFLWVTVHMHMKHEATEGGSQVEGQTVIKHAAQDEIHRKLNGDLIDGEILTVQAHFSKQVQLIPDKRKLMRDWEKGWFSAVKTHLSDFSHHFATG